MKKYPHHPHLQGQYDCDAWLWDRQYSCSTCKLKMLSLVLLAIAAINCYCFVFQVTDSGPISNVIHRPGPEVPLEPQNSLRSATVASAISKPVENNVATIASASIKLNVSRPDSSSSSNAARILTNVSPDYVNRAGNLSSDLLTSVPKISSDICSIIEKQKATGTGSQTCDIYRGKWVPDPHPPLYTSETCKHIIFDNQDCFANGRSDREYLQWRWKPKGCDLPRFNAVFFLELVRGKSMLFAGDSIVRNHMQSLLCALAQVEVPEDLGFSKWRFKSYNFVLQQSWSPFLVNYTVEGGQLWKLQVDKVDEAWTWDLNYFDYVVISASDWYFRNSEYYKGGKLVDKFTEGDITPIFRAMEDVWATVTRKLALEYRGVGIVRSVSLPHFEGAWNKGGTCNRTRPNVEEMEKGNEELPWTEGMIYNFQKEAVERSNGRVQFLDVTYNTLWRPDGHPSHYRTQKVAGEVRQDCVHWCLPGVIDSWNQLLFQLIMPFFLCSGDQPRTTSSA